ncbi:hypothetical protein AXF42_Ash005502 [Apostasia shenzhenica]|uniref:Uncharacterized protein n=1 Tax=Apostasia shenzhenica TaxID=1088818 RepID=A0A2I0B727_9ASPA|nr:hypothetical protein AXF42_Ash005502 [Apostasia shenzhenica]
MLSPSMCFFSSSASFLNHLLIFCLSPHPRHTITSTANHPPKPDVISSSQSNRPNLTFNPLNLESAKQLSNPADGDYSSIGINHPDWKRTGKIVQTVGLRHGGSLHRDKVLPLLYREYGKPLWGVGAEEASILHPLLRCRFPLPSSPPHLHDSPCPPSGFWSLRWRSPHLPLPLPNSTCHVNCAPRHPSIYRSSTGIMHMQ